VLLIGTSERSQLDLAMDRATVIDVSARQMKDLTGLPQLGVRNSLANPCTKKRALLLKSAA
jgi:hypothetical protein